MTVVVELKPLADCTVQEIRNIVQSGRAEECWNIGDAYPIALNGTVGICNFDNETWYAEIIGFNHNKDIETEGLPNVVFQFGKTEDGIEIAFIDDQYGDYGYTAGFRMNTAETNVGGWEASYMRNTICQEFLEVMPQEWQAIIKPTIKYTDNVGNATGSDENDITSTEDKIFILSEYEIFGVDNYSNTHEADYQTPYNDRYTSTSDRTKYRHTEINSGSHWATRSANRGSTDCFCRVDSAGSATRHNAYSSDGFAPAFTIF